MSFVTRVAGITAQPEQTRLIIWTFNEKNHVIVTDDVDRTKPFAVVRNTYLLLYALAQLSDELLVTFHMRAKGSSSCRKSHRAGTLTMTPVHISSILYYPVPPASPPPGFYLESLLDDQIKGLWTRAADSINRSKARIATGCGKTGHISDLGPDFQDHEYSTLLGRNRDIVNFGFIIHKQLAPSQITTIMASEEEEEKQKNNEITTCNFLLKNGFCREWWPSSRANTKL
ncbi:hypothetical protein DAPPUDRAFT_247184 [Daphnia pulex]|uniref:Uncharacterized protein n=1 Tax=Daphnia pulex TaxID=6669 RepID=E9GRX0_DAPPU|nr:hypothetical protein DAPPUDRAFT_247184 [Daphnia pulex]|eukprot:EFX77602.1 hypothetical protein DAPPUDRAFT_247184 [Daphnia pulex]